MSEKKSGNIAAALVKAQSEMTGAAKVATNSHFNNKYADLESVKAACMPALNKNGIAVIQPTCKNRHGLGVKTVFIHAESGERLSCIVPLITGRQDMQGYGSAVTYARRYGLMCMAGIAPEDDDGNAAVKAAPETPDRHIKFDAGNTTEKIISRIYKADNVDAIAKIMHDEKQTILNVKAADVDLYDKIVSAATAHKNGLSEDDYIPYQGETK